MNPVKNPKEVRIRPRSANSKADRIRCILLSVVVIVFMLTASNAYADSAQYKEYEVKAAFMFNFFKFVNWPKEKTSQDGNEIIVGIIGDDPFGPAIDIFKDKTIEDRKVVVKMFESMHKLKEISEKDKNERINELRRCHLLFICQSEQKSLQDIIEAVSNHGVLTVGDSEQFIESGGVINFLMENNKIRFDINLSAADKTGLEMRSQLLRLARKVVKDDANAPVHTGNANK
jgi:hypothetical protein